MLGRQRGTKGRLRRRRPWLACAFVLALSGAPASAAGGDVHQSAPASATGSATEAGGTLERAAYGPPQASGVAPLPDGLLSASMAPAPGRAAWTPEAPGYSVYTALNLPVRMSDGTVLRANVLFPADPSTGVPAVGSFPVLLTQTPYGKALSGPEPGLVTRGFIEVVADVRGTGDSHGQWGLLDPAQISDGVTLVYWAARLPHSNGRVGLFGASYLGINQLLTAAAVGPGSPLKAIFPEVAATDLYRDMAVMGGVPDMEFSGYFLGLTAGMDAALPVKEGTAAGADSGTPGEVTAVERDHLSGLTGFQASYLLDLEKGGDLAYDGAYWAERRPQSILATIVANHIPAYLVGGWRDIFQRGEPLNYVGLQNAWAGRPVDSPMRPNQPVTGRYQLLMGPWFHGNFGAGVDLQMLELQWFDTWLRDEPTGVDRTATPLHLYDVRGQHYEEASRWPLGGERAERLYLSGGRSGSASWSTNDGGLSPKPGPEGADTVAFAGASSPCTEPPDQWAGGLVTILMAAASRGDFCSGDDRSGQVGPGVLTYTTAPLAAPMVIGGPIGVTLFGTSTTSDAEWVVTVEDISPDGVSTPLTEGALLGSQRAVDAGSSWTAPDGGLLFPYHPLTRASASPLVSGQLTRFDIEVFPVFASLATGHSLRVTIATSDTPHLVPTPEQLAHLSGGVYQVMRGGGAASYVELAIGD